MFEFIGTLILPIVFYVASKQFKKTFFIELFLFLCFASFMLGSITVWFPQMPEWMTWLQIASIIIIYPVSRIFIHRFAPKNE